MSKNEKGFVYPIVLIICFALFYTVMMASDMMASERKFLRQKELLSEESQLLQAGAQFAMMRINSFVQQDLPVQFHFYHKSQSIACYIDSLDSQRFSVMIETISSTGRKKKAHFFYEKGSKKLTDWTEEKR